MIDNGTDPEYNVDINSCILRLTSLMVFSIEPLLSLAGEHRLGVSFAFIRDFKYLFLRITNSNGDPLKSSGPNLELELSTTTQDLLELRELIPTDLSILDEAIGMLIHRRIYEAIAVSDNLFPTEILEITYNIKTDDNEFDLSDLEYENEEETSND